MIWAAAVLAGGLGAVARYAVTAAAQQVARSTRPWGTATVNVSGAVVLGLLAGLSAAGRVGPDLMLVAGGGFLGAYTTFSTWMVETVRLAGLADPPPTDRSGDVDGPVGSDRGPLLAATNILAPLAVGLLGAALGYLLVGGAG